MAKKKKDAQQPAGEPSVAKVDRNAISVTVSGPAEAVQSALTSLRFVEDEWNPTITRSIAIAKTFVPETDLDDELGGKRLGMISQTARDFYVVRCADEARHRGHPVGDSSQIPAENDTTVMEVGDALFQFSKR